MKLRYKFWMVLLAFMLFLQTHPVLATDGSEICDFQYEGIRADTDLDAYKATLTSLGFHSLSKVGVSFTKDADAYNYNVNKVMGRNHYVSIVKASKGTPVPKWTDSIFKDEIQTLKNKYCPIAKSVKNGRCEDDGSKIDIQMSYKRGPKDTECSLVIFYSPQQLSITFLN